MKLEKGINFGGWLSQCNHTKERYDSFISKEDVEQVARFGLDHIRVPFDYNLITDENGNLIESGFSYLDKIISWCKDENLNVILDLHKAPGYDFNNAIVSENNTLFRNELLQEKFISIWNEVSRKYACKSNVAFELLNEVVENEFAEAWNLLIKKTVNAIRKNAPNTPIIYGGIQWNSASTLKFLDPPVDENVYFTFHFYEPLIFTHQKAKWVTHMNMENIVTYPNSMEYYTELSIPLGYKGKDTTDSKEKENVKVFLLEKINEAITAAKKQNVKLYCGEFGVIDQAPDKDSLNWFKDVFSIFHENNIGSAIWTYKEMDFGITGNHYRNILSDLIHFYISKEEI